MSGGRSTAVGLHAAVGAGGAGGHEVSERSMGGGDMLSMAQRERIVEVHAGRGTS